MKETGFAVTQSAIVADLAPRRLLHSLRHPGLRRIRDALYGSLLMLSHKSFES